MKAWFENNNIFITTDETIAPKDAIDVPDGTTPQDLIIDSGVLRLKTKEERKTDTKNEFIDYLNGIQSIAENIYGEKLSDICQELSESYQYNIPKDVIEWFPFSYFELKGLVTYDFSFIDYSNLDKKVEKYLDAKWKLYYFDIVKIIKYMGQFLIDIYYQGDQFPTLDVFKIQIENWLTDYVNHDLNKFANQEEISLFDNIHKIHIGNHTHGVYNYLKFRLVNPIDGSVVFDGFINETLRNILNFDLHCSYQKQTLKKDGNTYRLDIKTGLVADESNVEDLKNEYKKLLWEKAKKELQLVNYNSQVIDFRNIEDLDNLRLLKDNVNNISYPINLPLENGNFLQVNDGNTLKSIIDEIGKLLATKAKEFADSYYNNVYNKNPYEIWNVFKELKKE